MQFTFCLYSELRSQHKNTNITRKPRKGLPSSPPACTASPIVEVQKPCDLDLGSGQDHISIHNTCMTTSTPNHVTVASRITEIWPFERSLNSHDSFPRRKFENRPLISCRSGPTLSLPTISFEIHAKVAEEIDLEMCSYGQLSEVQMLHDLDLGSGQGHVNIHSVCRSTCVLNHVTVLSRTTEIWPFEFCQILILDEV